VKEAWEFRYQCDLVGEEHGRHGSDVSQRNVEKQVGEHDKLILALLQRERQALGVEKG
jgi:hypothetical protein